MGKVVVDVSEILTVVVVEDCGGSVVDVLLEVTGSKEVVVAEMMVDAVVDDDESPMPVDAIVLVTGVVTVVAEDAIVVDAGLEETGLEVVVTILEPSW